MNLAWEKSEVEECVLIHPSETPNSKHTTKIFQLEVLFLFLFDLP